MTKVCHITSVHKSSDARIFHKQCTSLAKAGYDVYLVAKGENCEKNGVKIINVPEVKGSRLKRMTQTTKDLYKKALEIDADIYQIHDPELLPYAVKLKKKGKKVIFDSHENYYLQITTKSYIPKVARKAAANIYRAYETHVCKKIDAVIFPCTLNGKNIFENRAKRSVIISNAPLMEELYDKFEDNYAGRDRTICYIGGLCYARGITHLIKAAYKAKVKLILAGKISDNYFKEIKSMEEYACVDFRGFVNRVQVTEILTESRIGLSTVLNVGQYNKYDNFSTKTYEYMATGLPVIVTDSAYRKKVNDKYDCFVLVDPENVDEIANAIDYLMDTPERAREMGQNGRRAVLEEFNWTIEEKKLLELYVQLNK